MKYCIIIPIYNACNTLQRCLDSILRQSYPDFEVLMIDDGSKDNSADIAASYSEKDNRFVLIRQDNAGPSSARNRGLDQASGDVIAFVDSDDFVAPDYLEQIDHAFENTGAQIVFFDVAQVEKDAGTVRVRNVPDLTSNWIEQMVALTKADMFGYTWVKAISRQVIGDTRFDESLNLFEDEVFTCEIMQKHPEIASVGKPIYYQVITAGSLSRKTHPDYFRKCDAVYTAWTHLLQSNKEIHPVLHEKANHMANVCKYYYLEKGVLPTLFEQGLANCTFFQAATVEDPIIIAIQKRRFVFARTLRIVYLIKVSLRKVLGR